VIVKHRDADGGDRAREPPDHGGRPDGSTQAKFLMKGTKARKNAGQRTIAALRLH
jgi:hypothetical protein